MASINNTDTDPKNYTPEQQRFALNMLANVVGSSRGTEELLESQFFTILNQQLPLMAGGWELAWGPKVYKDDPNSNNPPVNAWFVASSASQGLSVLSIAGTAPTSIMGWLQDFNVVPVIDWQNWVSTWSSSGGVTSVPSPAAPPNSTTAYIASGTAHGTANILTNKSTKASPNTYVYQYLQQLPAEYTVYVTGHSMGGALSPVVALGLVQADLVGGHNVIVLPSAGASPGNMNFTKLWTSQFVESGSGIGTINADFYNEQDVVPHAWCIDKNQDRNIYQMQQVYQNQKPGTLPAILIAAMIDFVTEKSTSSHIDYVGLPGAGFTTPLPIFFPITHFLQVFRDQHVTAYQDEVGVTPYVQKFKDAFQAPDGISDAWTVKSEDDSELMRFKEQGHASQDMNGGY